MSHLAPRGAPAGGDAPSVDRLALGINLAGDVMLLVCFVFFLLDLTAGYLAVPALSIAAWVVLIAVAAMTQLGVGRRMRLPANWFAIALAAFGVVEVLDVFGLLGHTGEHPWGPFPMAGIGIGGALVAFATTQSRQRLNLVASILGVLTIADTAFTAHYPLTASVAPSIAVIALAVLPPVIAGSIVRAFNAMLEFQSDLSQARGTTGVLGVGLARGTSEQLVKLDAQAERLLDDVASGRTPLPLTETLAEEASTIATRLRMSLVAGKSETWLHHALTESNVLGPISTIDDPDGLAAQLAPDQRDGLLTAIWMLAGDGERVAQSLAVTVRAASGAGAQTQRLAITLELIGMPKRRIDPAAWQAIGKVGRYSEFVQSPTLRIDVDCALDVVADR